MVLDENNGMEKNNGLDKMVWTKWYGQNGMDKMVWKKWYGQYGMDKMVTFFHLDFNSVEFNLYLITKSHKLVINTRRIIDIALDLSARPC